MNDERKTRRENKKIRAILRKNKKDSAAIAVATSALNNPSHVSKFKSGAEETFASFTDHGKYITIYDEKKQSYRRSYKDFIKLMQEQSSDEENDTFEHSNREDGPADDVEQCIKKEKESKKCCCLLI